MWLETRVLPYNLTCGLTSIILILCAVFREPARGNAQVLEANQLFWEIPPRNHTSCFQFDVLGTIDFAWQNWRFKPCDRKGTRCLRTNFTFCDVIVLCPSWLSNLVIFGTESVLTGYVSEKTALRTENHKFSNQPEPSAKHTFLEAIKLFI